MRICHVKLSFNSLLPHLWRSSALHGVVKSYLTLVNYLAHFCQSLTDHPIGTENVVNDIDYLSRAIEGDDAPINCMSLIAVGSRRVANFPLDWGISYGTIIGQYMVKILAPERIGRIVLDAVINPVQWAQNSLHFFDSEFHAPNPLYLRLKYSVRRSARH